jgi:hypothetical protein
VDIPVDSLKARQKGSLYRDLFGTDLSVVVEAYDAPWASHEQRILAEQILSGRKSVNTLSTQDLELLDDLAIRFNDQGGNYEAMRQAECERLRLLEEAAAREQDEEQDEEDDQEVQSEGESDLQLDLPADITEAYGWIRGEGDEKSGK